MTRIHLVRHGRPAAAWGGDDEDPGLDGAGHAQAAAVAARLLALPPGERPGLVVSSPLRRCRETAAPLARALGVPVEIDLAVGEIPTPATVAAAERPGWLRAAFAGGWRDIVGDIDYEAWRRAAAAAVAGRPGAAIFSHFVAINAVVSCARGDDRVINFRPDHTSITTLAMEDGRLAVLGLGAEAVTEVL